MYNVSIIYKGDFKYYEDVVSVEEGILNTLRLCMKGDKIKLISMDGVVEVTLDYKEDGVV